jgi:NADPH:quinone reductase
MTIQEIAMTTMMRAVHVTKIGTPEVLQVVTIQRPTPNVGEVLVRLSYSGVNYNDYMERTDFYRHPGAPERELPFILGEEGVGVVEEVGSEVSDFKPGQRVGFIWHRTKTYAEYSIVPANWLFPLPDDIPDQVAVALTHTGMTARALLYEYQSLGKGTAVLITGASGSIGSILVQWASQLGTQVIATVSSAAKVERVKQLGASVVIDISSQNLVDEVRKVTAGRGVDLALDAVGGEGFYQVLDALTIRGMVVPYGVAGGKYPSIDPLALIDRSRIIAGIMFFDFMRTQAELLQNINTVFDAYRQGWIKPVIAQVFPLEQVVDAHRLLESRDRMGAILLKI